MGGALRQIGNLAQATCVKIVTQSLAAQQSSQTLDVTSATLLEKLTVAMGEKTLTRQVRYYAIFDLLIIDEFGFDKLERREYPESASLLYKTIDARSGRGSTAFVTNVDFSDRSEYLVCHLGHPLFTCDAETSEEDGVS